MIFENPLFEKTTAHVTPAIPALATMNIKFESLTMNLDFCYLLIIKTY